MYKQILVFFLSIVAIKSSQSSDGKCRALALEGGGDRGAYHAGALSKFYDLLPLEEFQYDFCSGISAGSLNCAGWGLFEKGQEEQQIAFLNYTWNTITLGDVYKEWDGIFPITRMIDGLLFKPGLFDNSPLRHYLENILAEHDIVRNISVGATDMDHGHLQRFFSLELKNKEEQINSVLSSSAIPVFFPHIDWNNSSYSDGGLMTMIDIDGAIQHCVDQGYEQEDIILDAIYCAGTNKTVYKDESKATTLGILSRTLDIAGNSLGNSSFANAAKKYPNVDYRYFVIPPLSLESDLFMTFKHDQLIAMMNDGAIEAERIITEGPNFKKVMESIKERENEDIHEVLHQSYFNL